MSMRLKTKLLVSFLLVVGATGCLITTVGTHLVGRAVAHQAQTDVSHDLDRVFQLYRSRLALIRTAIAFTAIRPVTVCRALQQRDRDTLYRSLSRVREECGLDVLTAADAAGRVVLCTRDPDTYGGDVSGDSLVRAALTRREPVAAAHLWSGDNAGGDPDGLMLMAAAPVISDTGELAGVLYGGCLLDGRGEPSGGTIVDALCEAIYSGGSAGGAVAVLRGRDLIAASTGGADGARSCTSLECSEEELAALAEGRRWLGRCRIDGRPFFVASEPLRGVSGEIIGTIHVGIPESVHGSLRRNAVLVLFGVTLAGMLVAVAISFVLAAGILRPVRKLSEAVSQVSKGNLDYRLRIGSRGPLSMLAEAFNRMADSIKERDELIKRDAQEVMEARRLATLGQLAAGVAHEINNPLGGITVYAHLLLEDLPPDHPTVGNVQKIVREADRCKKIVKGLLDYSRQSGLQKERTSINTVLEAAAGLAAQQPAFANVTINTRLADNLPDIEIDVSQVEEVFTNILQNAAEAMKDGGEITIETSLSDDGSRVVTRIADSGPGIPADQLDHVFDPFFTSKETGHGTGLGLSISFGIVENHGGTIRAGNAPGGGAEFTVELPVTASRKEAE